MKYKFSFFFQLSYGVVSFAMALLIVYLFTKQLNWIAAGIIGVSEFIISGFYTRFKKCE